MAMVQAVASALGVFVQRVDARLVGLDVPVLGELLVMVKAAHRKWALAAVFPIHWRGCACPLTCSWRCDRQRTTRSVASSTRRSSRAKLQLDRRPVPDSLRRRFSSSTLAGGLRCVCCSAWPFAFWVSALSYASRTRDGRDTRFLASILARALLLAGRRDDFPNSSKHASYSALALILAAILQHQPCNPRAPDHSRQPSSAPGNLTQIRLGALPPRRAWARPVDWGVVIVRESILTITHREGPG